MDTQEKNMSNIEQSSTDETTTRLVEPQNSEVKADEDSISSVETETANTTSEQETETIAPLTPEELATITKPGIIERLTRILDNPSGYARGEVDALKQTYYKIRRNETEAEKRKFLENGGDEKTFSMPDDDVESQIKALVAKYKEKKLAMAAEEERQKEANYMLKLHLIERLKSLIDSHDDFKKSYNEFREIQRKWKETKLIPQEHSKELWRNYQLYNEQFYDLVKINNQFRDYDFKKNLELKTSLCETVERLAEEPDVISAFHQLQKLHGQWRDIGPVAKEFRDSIWERFKLASTVINKKHQSHFEEIKANEEKNLEAKASICEELEKIDYDALKTIKDWDRKTEEVISLQTKWRTIGFATKKQNVKIFERFRAACDIYFGKKSEFYKSLREEMDKNVELKKALIEKAESLKDSTDWKNTTKAFIDLQSEWKKTGPVPRKVSDLMWKQFVAACDYFFEQKNNILSSHKTEETENLAAKKAIIEKIESINENIPDNEALETLRSYISEWNKIGFVPFKEKDKIYKEFRDATDKQFDRLKVNERDRKMQQFRSSISDLAIEGKNKLYGERDRLMRIYDRIKNELQTYENNIGFLNVSSKDGGGMLKEMERKISRLKEDLEDIIKKIEAIDENLDKDEKK